MKILVTGSAGHLGEGLIRNLDLMGLDSVGLDIKESDFTKFAGSITDPDFVDSCVQGVDAPATRFTLSLYSDFTLLQSYQTKGMSRLVLAR